VGFPPHWRVVKSKTILSYSLCAASSVPVFRLVQFLIQRMFICLLLFFSSLDDRFQPSCDLAKPVPGPADCAPTAVNGYHHVGQRVNAASLHAWVAESETRLDIIRALVAVLYLSMAHDAIRVNCSSYGIHFTVLYCISWQDLRSIFLESLNRTLLSCLNRNPGCH